MSDGALSQDEIDALLAGATSMDTEAEAALEATQEPQAVEQPGLTQTGGFGEAEQNRFQDMLAEVAQSQGSILSMLTSKGISLGAPSVEVAAKEDIAGTLPDEVVQVKVDFTGDTPGSHAYYLPLEAANAVAGLMMGQSGGELDEAALSAVSEAVSQITGSMATALGDQVGKTLTPASPEAERQPKAEIALQEGEQFVCARYTLTIEGEADSTLTEVFSTDFATAIASSGQPAAAGQAAAAAAPPSAPAGMGAELGGLGLDMGAQSPGPMQPQAAAAAFGAPAPNVQPVQFGELQTGAAAQSSQGNISLLMDVFMEMTVELGRNKMPIKDILHIGEGTIIELDKLAGEPVDILVNQKLIAKGEVVVIDENFGVRVTEIIAKGIDQLGEVS